MPRLSQNRSAGNVTGRGRRPWLLRLLALAATAVLATAAAESPSAGPLFDKFDLTLSPGQRTEIFGPFYYEEQQGSQQTWAVPPLLSYSKDPATELKEFDFLYPLLTYDRYGDQYRWQLFQLFAFAGGPTQTETNRDRFTLFPLYFQQRSSDPAENYTAVFPFYGHLKHRLFKDEIFFVLFPAYGQTRKRDVVTDNYLYPFFHLRHGHGLRGWQFWPLAGHEHKAVTTRTNRFNDVQTVPGHDKLFVLWPFFFNDHTGLGTENPQWQQTSFPAYSILRSPKRDLTSALVLFQHVTDREKKYREWDLPWPLIEFARGEGKHGNRVWPFYSHIVTSNQQSDFYLWPVYRSSRFHNDTLDRQRTRILFFLYSDLTDQNVQTGKARHSRYLWPLFTRREDFNGNRRLQLLAPLEPFMAGSHKIPRDWSPVWSVWRSEQNPQTGAASQSLLWNLYRRDTTPEQRQVSALFGLFQYQSSPEARRLRLFYISL